MILRKKSAALLTTGLAAALALAGCSSGGNNSASPSSSSAGSDAGSGKPIEITFWNSFGGGEGDFVDQIIKGFNDSQKEVVVQQLRLESNDYYAKLSTALSSGKGPDVAISHVDRLAPFVNAKQVVPVDDLASKVGFDLTQITQSNLDSVAYNGQHYAVPLDTHFHMFYYNKDLLQQAGLLNDDGTPKLGEMTPEGFEQTLAQVQSKVPSDVQAIAVNTPYFQEPFLNMYYEAGGDLLNADMTKAAINNDKALSVLKFYQDLYSKKYADLNDKTPWDSFSKGKAAFWFGGVWEAGGLLVDSKNIGAMPLPPIFGSDTHWASSHTLIIPSYVSPEKQEAAAKFMRYYSEVGGSTWGKAGHVPANKNVTASQDYLNLPYRSEFLKAQKTVKFAPPTDKYNTIVTILAESLQNIIFGSETPENGLADVEKQINEVLQN